MSLQVSERGITVVAIPGTVEAAKMHGVYKVDHETGSVADLLCVRCSPLFRTTLSPPRPTTALTAQRVRDYSRRVVVVTPCVE
jgi:hypothetical protein